MRLRNLIVLLGAGYLSAGADQANIFPAATSLPNTVVPAKIEGLVDAADTVLPLKIQGYELRVLDRKKTVRFDVNGTPIETSLPIFVYFPTTDQTRVTELLRQVYSDLQKFGEKKEWTAVELQGALVSLDAALRLLESNSTSGNVAR